MNKEPFRISQEIFEKEIRYKIMAKFFKRKELAGDTESLFVELKMNEPIAIMGVRKKVHLKDFEKQIDDLIGRGCLEKDGDLLSITEYGEKYANSYKGESSEFLANY